MPEAVAINFPLHFKWQIKKTILFVIFWIFVNPIISFPSTVGAINFISKEIVTHGLPPVDL